MENINHFPVAIVGGGPVGLTTSIMLSRLGIRHVLLERHAGTSIHPKAVGLNQRTIEVFRQLGIEDRIRAVAAPAHTHARTAWYTSFAGPTDLHGRQIAVRDAWGGGRYAEEYAAVSPCNYTVLPQIRLEPVLRDAAAESEVAEIRFGSAVTAVKEVGDHVVLSIRTDDESYEVTADYVVGADGGRTVATELGIGTTGATDLVDMVSAHFSADLSGHVPDKGCLINWFVNPDHGGSIGSGYLYHLGPWDAEGNSKEWVFACGFAADDPERFDNSDMTDRIRRSIGVADLDIDLHSISHWYIQSVIADHFRSGRTFLVGDAAHRIPPWGALGLNTGIQDAHNLVWKLAAVMREPEAESLLSTYEIERRPIATSVAERSLHNFQSHGGVVDVAIGLSSTADAASGWEALGELFAEDTETAVSKRAAVDAALELLDEEFHAHGAECGFAYHAGALRTEANPAAAIPVDRLVYTPTTSVGHHLPHAWITVDGTSVSTLDLVTTGRFALIVGSGGGPWLDAHKRSGHPLADCIDVHVVDVDDESATVQPGESWTHLREVDRAGALLVRPDTIVAWRSMSGADDPGDELRRAYDAVLPCTTGVRR